MPHPLVLDAHPPFLTPMEVEASALQLKEQGFFHCSKSLLTPNLDMAMLTVESF